MKRYFFILISCVIGLLEVNAQYGNIVEGKCGEEVRWRFDGYTLTLSNVNKEGLTVNMDNYNVKENVAPWVKKQLKIKKVNIKSGIRNIGSCAFANCSDLQEVLFEGKDLENIGWGAFLNCNRLRNISLPVQLKEIETIAFANCRDLSSIIIPERCRLGDQAFVSCKNVKMIDVPPTAILGHHVFASETVVDGVTRHALYGGEIRRLPSYVNMGNCQEYGFSTESVDNCTNKTTSNVDYDYITSEVDTVIPVTQRMLYNTFVLIIGNQNYRFASNVPYAIHDARVFAEYCKKTLGIPAGNIHIAEDATKQMILEEEIEDWLSNMPNRDQRKLIVYYAGHGVPDTKNNNKAYILPTDVHGTNPQRGIALDALYRKLGDLAFEQTSVFLDACFSGVGRNVDHDKNPTPVVPGLRLVEIKAKQATFGEGSVVVFSAAQGNETAQGYPEEGHGLFTYYLLKELQTTQGNVDFGVMAENIKNNVSKKALELKMRKAQTPVTTSSDKIATTWSEMRF